MTISVTTALSLERNDPELLKILIKLHHKNFRNLHISYEGGKLIIHSEDENFLFQFRNLPDPLTNYKRNYFDDICEISSVKSYAFLPRGTISFSSLIESALQESISRDSSNSNLQIILQRIKNIQERQATLFRVASTRSDLSISDDFYDPADVVETMRRNMLGIPLPDQRNQDSIWREIEKERRQKEVEKNQNMAYEAKLVGIYNAYLARKNEPYSCESEILKIQKPNQVTTRTTEDQKKIGTSLAFVVTQSSQENLVMRDIELITKTLLQKINFEKLGITKRFSRNSMGNITGFEIFLHGLNITPRSYSNFVSDTVFSLYLAGVEGFYRFADFSINQLLQKKLEPASNNTARNTAADSKSPQLIDEEKLHELFSSGYKNDGSLSEKQHFEKALRNASFNGRVEDVDLFLKFQKKVGFDINAAASDSKPRTALHHCVSNGGDKHIECAKLLLKAGASVDRPDEDGKTARMLIDEGKNPRLAELAQLMQSKTLSPSIVNQPTLMRARPDLDKLRQLLGNKYKTADKLELKQWAENALRTAALRGNVADLKFILEFRESLKIDINSVSIETSQTALHHCVANYSDKTHVACAKLLIEAGASCDLGDKNDSTVRNVIASGENFLLNQLIIPPLMQSPQQ